MKIRRPFVVRFLPALAVASAVAISPSLYGCSKSPAPHPTDAGSASKPLFQASPAFHATEAGTVADVVESVLPSVVSVTSTKRAQANAPRSPLELFFGAPGGPSRPQHGLGSGVILSADGIVVTNNHVIDGADEVQVQTKNGREFSATVVGTDPKSDVAVLQLEGKLGELSPIRIGDSSTLRLGDVVLAVGNPFGVGQTVTMGIVSATGRSDMGIVDYENFIQTDAAINPGNSGGALINMRGELVGINTAILSRSGGSMGIGFAIPTSMASPIIQALRADGVVTRGFLGVRIQDLDSDLREALKVRISEGVLISDVEADGPADKAGLRSGDVVTHVGKEPVMTTGQFRNLIASAGADKAVTLQVMRSGKKVELKVKLGELPTEGEKHADIRGQDGRSSEVAGVALTDLDDNLRQRLSIEEDVKGAVITRVAPNSKAARAKLKPGDVILQIDHQSVDSAKDAQKLLAKAKESKGSMLLQILRHGARQFVVLK